MKGPKQRTLAARLKHPHPRKVAWTPTPHHSQQTEWEMCCDQSFSTSMHLRKIRRVRTSTQVQKGAKVCRTNQRVLYHEVERFQQSSYTEAQYGPCCLVVGHLIKMHISPRSALSNVSEGPRHKHIWLEIQ